ncbi:CHAT domain-containing protein [Novosphingobium sp. PS1R-30]|uniref:CHAT domain-containing protein n=1 Tax=Novosphingobium anseongense TaxID=3133436 RepID=A0ABU8RU41_9SPHN
MIAFEDAFPQLHAIRPHMPLAPKLAWVSALSWADEEAIIYFTMTVLERQKFAAARDLGWLEEISIAAVNDINALLREATERGEPEEEVTRRSLLFLRFLFSIVPMETAQGLGRRGPAYDWAFRGLSTDYDAERRLNSGYAYLPWRQEGDPRVGGIAMRWLPRWCTTFFLLARDANIRREVVETYAVCWDILLELLAVDGPGNEQLRVEIFFGLASLASWAVSEDYERGDEWVVALEQAWNTGQVPRESASVVATVFLTKANGVTQRSIRDWALDVLEGFGDTLREHERLQYLVATIDTLERWRAERANVFSEIESLNERSVAASEVGSSALFARDARIDVIKPLIRLLVLEQDLAAAMDLLRAWYKAPDTEPCDDNVLFVHPALGDGVATLWPGRARISFETVDRGHEIVVRALEKSLRIGRDPEIDDIEEHREGILDYSQGPAVEAAMMRYYRPGELAQHFKRIAEPRSLVVFPSVSDPLQALLARELSLTLPLEVSLAATRPMRAMRTISIWAAFTYFTHFEVEVIQAVAARNGWSATVFPGSEDGDADDFRDFYEQVEPDILWVSGHGEFVAHRLAETGIVVGTPRAERQGDTYENVILPMETIASFSVPEADRRLLVLNTCNGATTQGMAGMARIGLAQSLVQPTQMVLAHLWPASPALGLAFGGLFASNLVQDDVTGAFASTLAELRDPDKIVGLIEERSGIAFPGAPVITRAASELSSILAWGCPVLLT